MAQKVGMVRLRSSIELGKIELKIGGLDFRFLSVANCEILGQFYAFRHKKNKQS